MTHEDQPDWRIILGPDDVCVMRFDFGEAITTIRVLLHDPQSGADILITNMTTLPFEPIKNKYGSRALQSLLRASLAAGAQIIMATQVQDPSVSFWIRNGFVPLNNETKDYIYAPSQVAH